MWICCSSNILNFLKIVIICCYFCENCDTFFLGFFDELKEQHLFEIEIFCNIIYHRYPLLTALALKQPNGSLIARSELSYYQPEL